ncbi:GNAT family N-acetyltransferase [Streptomyces sp. NPDC003737]|uniref:GNAT family N-acetyltransferase n=1 Tax=Streptomyces sp. NPDC003737 TaxID=3364685 RepID=UPI00368DB440
MPVQLSIKTTGSVEPWPGSGLTLARAAHNCEPIAVALDVALEHVGIDATGNDDLTPRSEDHATQGNIKGNPVNPEMNVQKNGDSGSYEAVVDGQVVGMIVYHTPHGNQRVTLSHTVVEPEYRGRGIATRLVKHALDDLRVQDLKLTNYCPFVADYIADHPEYKELVDSRFPGRATVPDRAPRERAN